MIEYRQCERYKLQSAQFTASNQHLQNISYMNDPHANVVYLHTCSDWERCMAGMFSIHISSNLNKTCILTYIGLFASPRFHLMQGMYESI